jgi:polysaccharide export outer membrane protein
MLSDAGLKGGLSARALPYSNYKIKMHDNLFVSIVSSNREMNDIYNPATVGSSGGGSGNNQWATLSGQFVYGYIVDKDGFVTLPGIGKVHVLGMTLEESEKEIALKANQYLKEVTAKVRLLNYKVTVIGEVNGPGVYYNYNPEFTVFDAISMANGVKNTAAINKILVLREIGDQTQTYRLDLKSIATLNSEGFNLQPNDVVVVQPAKFKNLELQLPIYSITVSTITTFLLILRFLEDSKTN